MYAEAELIIRTTPRLIQNLLRTTVVVTFPSEAKLTHDLIGADLMREGQRGQVVTSLRSEIRVQAISTELQ